MSNLGPLSLYLLAVLFCVPTQNFDLYYIQEPLTISFEKTSVALAALKDTQEYEVTTELAFNTLASEPLVDDKIKTYSGPRIIAFDEGLTVSKDEILLVEKNIKREKILASLQENLSPQQINRLMLSDDLDKIVFEDWQGTSIKEEIKKYLNTSSADKNTLSESADALQAPSLEVNALARDLEQKSQPILIISRRDEAIKGKSARPKLLAKNDSPPPTPQRYFDKANALNLEPAYVEPTSQILRGTFEFIDGLALLFGQHELEIVHEIDGVVYSEATIQWSEAAFDLPVHKLEGYMVANVRDHEGFIIGGARLGLSGLPSDSHVLSGFHLGLSPYVNGIFIHSISAYSFDDYIQNEPQTYIGDPLQTAFQKTDEKGIFQNRLVKNGSTLSIQAKSKGHWTTTKYIEAGQASQVPIFSDSMISALIETLKEQGFDKASGNYGIVWGKIKNHKNAAGAEVRITDRNAFGPAYLNHLYLPQTAMAATAANGYFIFAGVEPGLHTIEIRYDGKVMYRTVEVHRHNVSYLDVEVDNMVEQRLAVLDVDEKVEDVELYIPGTKEKILPSNPFSISSVKSAAPHIVEFREQNSDYIFRANLPQNKAFLNLRFANHDRLKKIIKFENLTNAVLGFINPQAFSGIFLNRKELAKEQIVYFNFDFEIIPYEQLTLRWNQVSGFFIYNIAEGPHNIQIFDERGLVTQHEILMGMNVIHLLPEWTN